MSLEGSGNSVYERNSSYGTAASIVEAKSSAGASMQTNVFDTASTGLEAEQWDRALGLLDKTPSATMSYDSKLEAEQCDKVLGLVEQRPSATLSCDPSLEAEQLDKALGLAGQKPSACAPCRVRRHSAPPTLSCDFKLEAEQWDKALGLVEHIGELRSKPCAEVPQTEETHYDSDLEAQRLEKAWDLPHDGVPKEECLHQPPGLLDRCMTLPRNGAQGLEDEIHTLNQAGPSLENV